MRKDRYAKFCGDFQRRARLWCVEQQVTARAFEQQTTQPKFPDGAFGLASGTVAVIGIDRRQP